jgi:hypothetical protein
MYYKKDLMIYFIVFYLDFDLQKYRRPCGTWGWQAGVGSSECRGLSPLVSQAVFAAVLNTSLSTVQKWEVGDKKPSGPSLKLLNLIERKGLEAII